MNVFAVRGGDTRILMYLDVSQTYLTCSVTFQENTCILTCCMYFTRISNEFKIHAGYVSYVLPCCHSGYISEYIRIHVSWTLHHDTSRYTEIHEAAEASIKAPKAPKAAAKAAKAAAMAPKESPRRASTRGRK